jgi:hypothetical protein
MLKHNGTQTNTSLLAQVRTFGNDFVEGAPGQPMTGTELSAPQTFSYGGDVVSVGAPQSYAGVKFGPRSVVFDVDQDGREEIIQSTKYADGELASTLSVHVPRQGSGDNGTSAYDTPENSAGRCAAGPTVGKFDFDGSSVLAQSALPAGVASAEVAPARFLGLTSFDPIAQTYYAISRRSVENRRECGSQDNECGDWNSQLSVLPLNGGPASILSSTSGSSTFGFNPPPAAAGVFGNFDADAAPEAYMSHPG